MQLQQKQIPAVEVPAHTMSPAPQDGKYAIISHNPKSASRFALGLDVFPWNTVLYQFKNGLCDEAGWGSNPGSMLAKHDVKKVFVSGTLTAELKRKLHELLARHGVTLVHEQIQ